MPRNLTDKEMAEVSSLAPDQRYQHFIDLATDQGSIWSLQDADGWCTVANEKDQTCFPVWPHARYASAWAIDEFAACVPTEIPVEEWLGQLHKAAINCRWKIAVFPTSEDPGVLVDPNRFAAALESGQSRNE
jgi:hypothetical protein